jgi:cysteine-rich repeat protein
VLYFVIFGLQSSRSSDGTGTFDLILTPAIEPELGEACVAPNWGGRACPEGSVCQGALGEAATCGEPACGDGLLSFDPLDCEDGNDVSGDGCSTTCKADRQGAGSDTCATPTQLNFPAMRGTVDDGVFSHALAAGTFIAGSELTSSCAEAAGPEAVYVIELDQPQFAQLSAEEADVLSVRRAGESDCGTEELACAVATGAFPVSLTLDLEPGRYSIIVDRNEPTLAMGADYSLSASIRPPP